MSDEQTTRDEMVEAIITVWIRDGLARLTYQAVASECGRGKSHVLHYFRSTHELIRAGAEKLGGAEAVAGGPVTLKLGAKPTARALARAEAIVWLKRAAA